MSEEVRKIVGMLGEGQINEEEAIRLLEAATKTAPRQAEEVEPEPDVQQQMIDAVKSVKDRLNLPARMALIIAVAALFFALLNVQLRGGGLWQLVFLIVISILAFALVRLIRAQEKQ